MSALSVTNACVYFNGRQCLRDVSVELPEQSVTLILGENAAGKSIFMRTIHGVILADKGEIRWNGNLINKEIRKEQSFVFQHPVFFQTTVAKNLSLVARSSIAMGKETDDNITEMLHQFELDHKSHMYVYALSGGERQKLSILRALLSSPKVLLLDEPTVGMDMNSISIVYKALQTEIAKGTKIIWVTHDLREARRWADDVLFISEGTVSEYAESAEEFFCKPRTEQAKIFLSGIQTGG